MQLLAVGELAGLGYMHWVTSSQPVEPDVCFSTFLHYHPTKERFPSMEFSATDNLYVYLCAVCLSVLYRVRYFHSLAPMQTALVR